MLSGDSRLRSFDADSLTYLDTTPIANRVSFHCIEDDDVIPEQPFMFETNCSQGMRAQIKFPSCWNGVDLYLPDSAHVAYQSGIGEGVCPPGFDSYLPVLYYEVLYWTIDVDQADGGQFVFAQGDITGYGFHGDFVNGWNQAVLVAAVQSCLSQDQDGTISSCPILSASDDVNFPRDCPEQAAVVPEQVHGLLTQLPGCNPIINGPQPAPQEICEVGYVDTSALSSILSTTIPTASTSIFAYSETVTTSVGNFIIAPFTNSSVVPVATSYEYNSSCASSFPSTAPHFPLPWHG